MIKHIVKMSDGTVRNITLVKGTIEQLVAKLSLNPEWTRGVTVESLHEVQSSDLPDREFRDAWTHNGTSVKHDLNRARNIQLTRMREARAPKLADLDRESEVADKLGDNAKKREVEAKKRALRDITEPLKAARLTDIKQVKDAFPRSLRS